MLNHTMLLSDTKAQVEEPFFCRQCARSRRYARSPTAKVGLFFEHELTCLGELRHHRFR